MVGFDLMFVMVRDCVLMKFRYDWEWRIPFWVHQDAVAGAQPANIDEGIAFGGIFMENSAAGTITLQ